LTSGCLCKDSSYIETYRLCVRASCDMANVLIAKNATWTWCDYHYQNQTGSKFEKVVLVIITALAFFLRQLAKILRLSAWGADDYMLVLGYVFFAFEVLYTISIGALKASILFFYLHIFRLVNPAFTTVLWCTQASNFANCVAFTVAKLNQCKPFSYSWEGWDGRHLGRCVNLHAMLISHAALNVAMNVWMLALPMTQVLWLNLRKRQKVEVLSMFGLGIFIIIVSAIRLNVLFKFRNFSNPTHDVFYLHMWSYIELSVAVIVSCLPSIRQVWRELVPRLKTKIGLGPSAHATRSGESARRLNDIMVFSEDQLSPKGSNRFMPSHFTSQRNEGLEESLH
ncbi:CFEM domain-containing protein, partial [Colletotrichum tofieldiae]